MPAASRNELVRLAVALGADARREQPGRHPDDAWDAAWEAICWRLGAAAHRDDCEAARRAFLEEFRP